jgi:glycosyltransferase involved in cell wall biosynthesis
MIEPQMEPRASQALQVAVVLPCYNEELAVAQTVEGFRASLPSADIYVIDNNSSDLTGDAARAAGAIVLREVRRGKGNAVRRAFADINADVFVMADGDGTYDPQAAVFMIDMLLREHLDMVTGIRVHSDPQAYRAGHVLGNRAFNHIVNLLFGERVRDLFSGYRVLTRRFVKSFPAMSAGFEIEAEMGIHALSLRLAHAERDCDYRSRMTGSHSKLNTYRDGMRILSHVLRLLRLYRPRKFYGSFGLLLALVSLGLGVPLVHTFLLTGQVPRFPTAILATGLAIVGALLGLLGLVLESVSQLTIDMKRLSYLQHSSRFDSRLPITRSGRPVPPPGARVG